MCDFFEQKNLSDKLFRLSINQFFQQSKLLAPNQQFTAELLDDLLGSFITNSDNKISLQNLYEQLKTQDGSHVLNESTFKSIFGPKKQMKVSQLASILKHFDLHEFDPVQQIEKSLFDKDMVNIEQLNELTKNYYSASGLTQKGLTAKNKQLIIESFDVDKDGKISAEDLGNLVKIAKKTKQQMKEEYSQFVQYLN